MNSGEFGLSAGDFRRDSAMLNDDRWEAAALCAREVHSAAVNISQPQYSIGRGSGVRLEVVEERGCEVIHFFEEATASLIESRGSAFHIRTPETEATVKLPLPPARRALSGSRIARRMLRLDKANALFTADRSAVVLVYQGLIWRYDLRSGRLEQTGTLRQSRNVLHGGVAIAPDGRMYFGEYGATGQKHGVPIYMSDGDGRNWRMIYEFPPGQIMHIHGVFYDPFEGCLWVTTGDFEGECGLVRCALDFSSVERLGDGSQSWRMIRPLFEPDRIVWGMDSQLRTPFLRTLDRATGELAQGQAFPGPVWYNKQLSDGITLLSTGVEPGPAVTTDSAHLYVSGDNQHFQEAARTRKDRWPSMFKMGVLAFADGEQSSSGFAMFGEALEGWDGRACICRLA